MTGKELLQKLFLEDKGNFYTLDSSYSTDVGRNKKGKVVRAKLMVSKKYAEETEAEELKGIIGKVAKGIFSRFI